MICMMMLDYRFFTHGGVDLLFEIVYEFRSHILAIDKPTRVINIPE